ncbi:dTDP-4-dehydrorhamnose 3,5-epimerase [Chelatococcus sp. GCM10030263]|uniref:dTDP-4-dehydrorhamnose 3,5-epimerase n=1 Tax=Chelatococcus sp. GCM10030263 TaxID=3273387 RepID=UPI00360A83A0
MTTFERLAIPDVILAVPDRFGDHRGYFTETYVKERFAAQGITADFVQDNESLSPQKGTLRGLHFQVPPRAQAKLVRVLAGAIFDVAVDIRQGSPSFGRWVGATLTAERGEQLYIPQGFAHGFCTLAPDTRVAYKVDDYYAKAAEGGVIWNDPDIAVAWPLDGEPVLSDKDKLLPRLKDYVPPFIYAGECGA